MASGPQGLILGAALGAGLFYLLNLGKDDDEKKRVNERERLRLEQKQQQGIPLTPEEQQTLVILQQSGPSPVQIAPTMPPSYEPPTAPAPSIPALQPSPPARPMHPHPHRPQPPPGMPLPPPPPRPVRSAQPAPPGAPYPPAPPPARHAPPPYASPAPPPPPPYAHRPAPPTGRAPGAPYPPPYAPPPPLPYPSPSPMPYGPSSQHTFAGPPPSPPPPAPSPGAPPPWHGRSSAPHPTVSFGVPTSCQSWVAATDEDVRRDGVASVYRALLAQPDGTEKIEIHNGRMWKLRVITPTSDPSFSFRDKVSKSVRGWVCGDAPQAFAPPPSADPGY